MHTCSPNTEIGSCGSASRSGDGGGGLPNYFLDEIPTPPVKSDLYNGGHEIVLYTSCLSTHSHVELTLMTFLLSFRVFHRWHSKQIVHKTFSEYNTDFFHL